MTKAPAKKNGKGTDLKTQQQITLEEVTKLLDNDVELAQFFIFWLENGHDAQHAYLKLRPNVTPDSAKVIASRWLTRINVAVILEALGLGAGKYFEQLTAGLNAEKKAVLRKYDKQGNIIQEIDLSQPDHKTRRLYHEPLGKMLEFEKERGAQTLNYFDFSKLGNMIHADEVERGLAAK